MSNNNKFFKNFRNSVLSTQNSARLLPASPPEGKGQGGEASALNNQSSALHLRVADITISILGMDPSLKLQLQGAIQNFSTPGKSPDMTIETQRADLSRISIPGEKIFDSGATWRLFGSNGNYNFYLSSEAFGPIPYKMAAANKAFTEAKVFLHHRYFASSQPFYPLEYPLDELLFVHFLSLGRGAEIHSSGVVDSHGRGHLFIGQSGAGKSTMTRLWQDEPGITILSDDRIIVRKMDGTFWIYGTPWHGEGRFSSPARAQLSRIYFLEKGKKTELNPYRTAESIASLTACSFLPFYKPEALDFTMAFFEEMVKTVPTYELRFVPDRRVVKFINGIME